MRYRGIGVFLLFWLVGLGTKSFGNRADLWRTNGGYPFIKIPLTIDNTSVIR